MSARDDAAERIVFYDGVCGFCDASVRWLIERDPHGRLRFAPLQGETAAELRARRPDEFPAGLDTLVYVERTGDGPRVLVRTRALREILAALGIHRGWRFALRWIPRPIADLGYAAFARIRYRVFGRIEACPVPERPADLRGRFLP